MSICIVPFISKLINRVEIVFFIGVIFMIISKFIQDKARSSYFWKRYIIKYKSYIIHTLSHSFTSMEIIPPW